MQRACREDADRESTIVGSIQTEKTACNIVSCRRAQLGFVYTLSLSLHPLTLSTVHYIPIPSSHTAYIVHLPRVGHRLPPHATPLFLFSSLRVPYPSISISIGPTFGAPKNLVRDPPFTINNNKTQRTFFRVLPPPQPSHRPTVPRPPSILAFSLAPPLVFSP